MQRETIHKGCVRTEIDFKFFGRKQTPQQSGGVLREKDFRVEAATLVV